MAHQISRIITIGALIVACTLASACGSTVGAADEDRPAQQSAPSIAPYTSSVDKDGDGVDDQSDILQNAHAYIATKPAYKSEYYATGYPNDGVWRMHRRRRRSPARSRLRPDDTRA